MRLLIVGLCSLLLTASTLRAQGSPPMLDDVLRSIGDNLDKPVDNRPLFAGLAVVAGALLILVIYQQRTVPRRSSTGAAVVSVSVNKPAKLSREIARRVGLRRGELRALRHVSETQKLKSPLTLLICPSLLARAVKDPDATVDRKALLGLARRIGSPGGGGSR